MFSFTMTEAPPGREAMMPVPELCRMISSNLLIGSDHQHVTC